MVLLLVPMLVAAGMLAHREVVKRHQGALRNVLLVVMLSQQVLLYSWYYFTGNFSFTDALPLYPCRISSLLCIGLLLFWNRKAYNLLFFMGIPGATLALFFPDTWHLGFPNAMMIQFFLGHSGILLTTFFLMVVHDYIPKAVDLSRACQLTLIYLAALIPVNALLGSNYAYMAKKPDISILSFMPAFPYHIPIFIGLMFGLYALVFFIFRRPESSPVRRYL